MQEPSAAPPVPLRVLLIDLDNCPQQISQLPANLDGFSRIVVCYGSQEPKLPLGLVTALAEPILGGHLEVVGMEKKGKNAADFGLCFHAGKLMAEMPPDTEFILLSEDGDLDHAVNMLRANQRTARRVNGKTATTSRTLDASAVRVNGKTATTSRTLDTSAVEIAGRDYADHRLQAKSPRPASRKALLNDIKAYTKTRHAVQPQYVLDWLQDNGWVENSNSGKIRYVDGRPEIARAYPSPYDDDIPF